jgi:hypothetical protein
MNKVFRIILTGLAILTIAIPDMVSEILRGIKGYLFDLKDKTTDNIHELAKGLTKSSAEETR